MDLKTDPNEDDVSKCVKRSNSGMCIKSRTENDSEQRKSRAQNATTRGMMELTNGLTVTAIVIV